MRGLAGDGGLDVSGGERATAGRWTCVLAGRVDGMDAAALAARGERALDGLRGEFAVLLWDGSRGFAAIDQLGARSLYWCAVPGGVAFACDLRDLLELLPATPAPDRAELLDFLSRGAWSRTGTPLAGVQRLPGGGRLELSARPRVRPYWEPAYRPPLNGTGDELAELVRERTVAAVSRHLPETGAAGVLLSGGLDSSIVAGAAHAAGARLHAYSGVFPEHEEIDESALVGQTVRYLGADWTRTEIRGGRPLVGMLEHVGEWRQPAVAPNVFLWPPLLRRAADDGVPVLLDGQGGDELFGVTPFLIADAVRRGRLGRARELARRIPGVGPAAERKRVDRLVRHYAIPAALPWTATRLLRRRAARWDTPWFLRPGDVRTAQERANPWRWTRHRGPRWWVHLAYTLTELRDELDALGYFHRRARQAGVHDAHPLLSDVDLVELALALPPLPRFDPVHDRPLARAAMRGLIPEALRLRQGKSYFTALLGGGLRGPDAELLDELLRPATARIAEYTDHGKLVRDLLDTPPGRYARGRAWWGPHAWRAATLEIWLREMEDPGWARRRAEAEGPAVQQRLIRD